MAASIFLRQSNVKLQEELRKTNTSYSEEKTALRSHLNSLRLDLSELHHDNRTITDDGNSAADIETACSGSAHELKRLAEFDTESGRSLQLPSIRNLNMSSSSPVKKDIYNHHKKDRRHGGGGGSDTARSGKTIRFTGNNDDIDHQCDYNYNNKSSSEKQESQKFLELQKNQEVLRNIGRANLKEKRQSLIRLPTISSAKKRNKLWDSGNNVSRPNGQSTSFEHHPKLYVEDSIIMTKRAYKIPSIKDSLRSEIQLSRRGKRPPLSKRKVQFTRPRAVEIQSPRGEKNNNYTTNSLDTSTTEVSSLNTSFADVSLEDNTLGNITFDEEAFNKQLESKHDQTSSTIKPYNKNSNNNNNNNDNNNKRLNKSSSSPLPAIEEQEATRADNTSNDNATDKSCLKNTTNTTTNNNNAATAKPEDQPTTLPPIKIKTLAKKNLILHDMNNMRTSPTFPKLGLSPENRSVKDSDRSVGTKLSRMSQETESWKSTYQQFCDPERRNKTLTEIMFAVRSRMRENEESLKFGETPKRQDKSFSDFFLGNTPRNIASPKWSDATQSPRKGKISRRGRPTIPPTKAEKSTRRNDSTGQLQGYLRKMCRHKTRMPNPNSHPHPAPPARTSVMSFHHKQPQIIAQEA